MRVIFFLIMLVFIALISSFALLNAQMMTVDLFVTSYRLPLSVLLLIAFGLGLFLGYLTTVLKLLKLKRQCWQLKREQHSKDKEIKELRTIPFKE